MKELSKIYDPKQVEDRTYQFGWTADISTLSQILTKTIHYRNSTTEHYRSAAHGSRTG